MTIKNQTFTPTVKFFIAVAALVITLWGMRQASQMIVQLSLAAIITVSFTPLMYYMIRRGFPSMVAYALTLVAIVLVFGLAAVLVAVLASLIPAFQASRKEPAESLHFV